MVATLPRETVLKKEKIEGLFRLIDRETQKVITAEKLYSVFGMGGEVDGNEWVQLVKRVDKTERGGLDMQEFRLLIDKIFE